MPRSPSRLAKPHYETLAALRLALRRFQRFSSEKARESGLTPQQHQALLTIKGFPGREYASVGEIADQLHLRHHSAVGLVDRLEKRGLVKRKTSKTDRRRIDVRITRRGENTIAKLSEAHLIELRQLSPQLRDLLSSISTE